MTDSDGQRTANNTLHSPIIPSQDVDRKERGPKDLPDTTEDVKTNIEKADLDADAIGWEGDDDPENPQNWPESKKWGMVVILAFITFLTSVTVLREKNQVLNIILDHWPHPCSPPECLK